jgi:hypothetical protein
VQIKKQALQQLQGLFCYIHLAAEALEAAK